MILQIIKLKSNLPEAELLRRAKEREPLFKLVPGLLQKFYVKSENSGQYGGVYLWETQKALNDYLNSELAKSIPEAYEIIDIPNMESLDIIFQLRE